MGKLYTPRTASSAEVSSSGTEMEPDSDSVADWLVSTLTKRCSSVWNIDSTLPTSRLTSNASPKSATSSSTTPCDDSHSSTASLCSVVGPIWSRMSARCLKSWKRSDEGSVMRSNSAFSQSRLR